MPVVAAIKKPAITLGMSLLAVSGSTGTRKGMSCTAATRAQANRLINSSFGVTRHSTYFWADHEIPS